MNLKSIATVAAALSLSFAPTMAAAQSAQALSIAPAAEQVDADSKLFGGIIIPALVIAALLGGVLVFTDWLEGDDDAVSA